MASLSAVFFVFVLVFYSVNSISVYVGTKSSGDRLLHKSEHVKTPNLYIRTIDIAFPKYYEESDNIITAVYIIDNADTDEGASAEVDYGGIGLTYANVHLRSALWGGFNYTVEIYGTKMGYVDDVPEI
ncbi:jg25174 [Pararge aegeria aegeria]|uniref:Jg25174 protein n=1 Tax=Pararge aegeria aegeria TaxID=348720 RepID=A0A8S4RY37_9NEOP|nr:jg25174 [Pararge aegeria aegeria]